VEGVLIEIDGVIEAAVIGAASPDKGQTIVAFLTCEDAPEDICALARARIKDRLGAPFVPSAVYMVSQLPKTRSSKIMRRVIRSVHSGSPPGDLSSLVNPEVIDEIARVIKNE
jgi:acetyl-CoA synthetase